MNPRLRWWMVAPGLLLTLLVGCATTGLPAVKEALLYDKTVAETAYADAARAYVRGTLSQDRFNTATVAYTKWRDAHVAAVHGVDVAETAEKLGTPPSQAQLTALRTAAANLLLHLVTLLQTFGVVK